MHLHGPHSHEWVHADPTPSPTPLGLAAVSLSNVVLLLFLTHHTSVLFLKRAWAPCGCGWGAQLSLLGFLGCPHPGAVSPASLTLRAQFLTCWCVPLRTASILGNTHCPPTLEDEYLGVAVRCCPHQRPLIRPCSKDEGIHLFASEHVCNLQGSQLLHKRWGDMVRSNRSYLEEEGSWRKQPH